jgi:hypothetical protein
MVLSHLNPVQVADDLEGEGALVLGASRPILSPQIGGGVAGEKSAHRGPGAG